MLKPLLWSSLAIFLTMSTTAYGQSQTSSAVISTPPSVQSLLEKMSRNASSVNYRGVFTYQNQSSSGLQSFKVDHWLADGQQHDRLVFLNGPEREILREGQPVSCKAMGDKLLQGSFAALGSKLIQLTDLYEFDVRSQERVAGRLARVLRVLPKDPYRYGYFLSIDEQTGLVLKAWLIDQNANPLERYQFISIDFDPANIRQPVEPISLQHKAIADITPCNPESLPSPKHWLISWVPPGFIFAGERALGGDQDMLMYTDGLTTFSIFLEPATSLTPEGVGQRGATLAYMSRLTHADIEYRISVVGEIPVAAAAKIAQNIAKL